LPSLCAISRRTSSMSSARAAATTCSSVADGSAPACAKTTMLSRKTINGGIDRMPKWPATSGSASVSTFANRMSG